MSAHPPLSTDHRSPVAHWALPFFDAAHGEIGRSLGDWLPAQSMDESDDRAACKAWVKLLGAHGWLRYCVPAAHGGALPQLDSRALVVMRETLAFYSPLADFAFAMQGLGSGAITLGASAELQARYLPKVAQGEAIAAFALSEPDAGSDVAAMQTVAAEVNVFAPAHDPVRPELVEGHPGAPTSSARTGGTLPQSLHSGSTEAPRYRLQGSKTWISNGGIADFYATFAKTDPAAGARGISAFVVDAATPGLRDDEHIQVMAPHPLATLRFEACEVPASHMLGELHGGFKLAMRVLDIFRPSVAAAAIGMARRALVEARAYAQSRKMFGATLADQQLAVAKFGQMTALIEAGAMLTYRAAWLRDRSASDTAASAAYPAAAAMAKLVAPENASRVIDMALQMHGGRGVEVGSKIEALYRDVRALRIYEGASEVQELILGKAVLRGVL